MKPHDFGDHNPATAELLEDAYVSPVDVETAARHLWVIHTEAARLQRLREALPSRAEGPDHSEVSEYDRRGSIADRRDRSGSGDPATSSRRTVPRAALPRALAPLLALVMMLSTSGVALAASQSSLPGDMLYAVKRGTEAAQLVFARSPEARAQLQLAFAQNRLEEIRQVGEDRPEKVPSLVADITISLSEAERSAPEEAAVDSERIRQQTSEQIAQMSLPVEVTAAVDEVIASAPSAQSVVVGQAPPVTPTQDRLPAEPRLDPEGADPDLLPTPTATATDVPTPEATPPPTEIAAVPPAVDAPEGTDAVAGATDAAPAPGDGRPVGVDQSAVPSQPDEEGTTPPAPVPPVVAVGATAPPSEGPVAPTATPPPGPLPTAPPTQTPARPTPEPAEPPAPAATDAPSPPPTESGLQSEVPVAAPYDTSQQASFAPVRRP